LEKWNPKRDRTGRAPKVYFGYQMRFDLADGFPMVTTKKTTPKIHLSELLLVSKGDTNIT